MSTPLLSVVIPTRDRAGTLERTLGTCVSQEFADVEFIVSNNVSTDNTEQIVNQFRDKRIKLVRPHERVSMRENWEFALSQTTGQYVMYIGDDDGLVPEALSMLAELIRSTGAEAIKWQSPTYPWAGTNHPRSGWISLNPSSVSYYVKSRSAINALRWGYLTYHFMPMIYYGAISRTVIDRMKDKSGAFFCSDIPDIYSGVAVAACTDKYLYTSRPITLAGLSKHSAGTSYMSPDADSKAAVRLAFQENKLAIHPDSFDLSRLPASQNACITDSFLRAREALSDGKLWIPKRFRLLLTWRDVRARGDAEPGQLETVRKRARSLGMHWSLDLYDAIFRKRAAIRSAGPGGIDSERPPSVDLKEFGIADISGAASFVGKWFSGVSPDLPSRQISSANFLWSRVVRLLSRRSQRDFFVL